MTRFITSYDTTLSSAEWAATWSSLLKSSDSWEALPKDCQVRGGLGLPGGNGTSSASLARSTPAVPTAFAFPGKLEKKEEEEDLKEPVAEPQDQENDGNEDAEAKGGLGLGQLAGCRL